MKQWLIWILTFGFLRPDAAAQLKPDQVFHEYLIALGEEEQHLVQCVVTFRRNDEYGKPVKLAPGYKVFLDDREMPLDEEVYPTYSKEEKREGFKGKHVWKLTGPAGTLLEIPFQFFIFKRISTLPDTMGRKDVEVSFEGLPDGARLLFWFDNREMENETDRFTYEVRKNKVLLPATDLQKLRPGTYSLRIFHDQEKPVILNGRERGKSEVSYILTAVPVILNY